MELLITAAVIYFLIGVVWSRVYFKRRHGVRLPYSVRLGDAISTPGGMTAAAYGLSWPLTLVTSRDPSPCTHKDHVLARAQDAAEHERYMEALRAEGR